MKYIIEFSKKGTICYTSHLDIMKVFRRAFKKAGIDLAYSQGFNPHPKMGFGQPLSLGYRGLEEYVEFETAESQDPAACAGDTAADPEAMLGMLRSVMPEGLELLRIMEAPWLKKTLAAENIAAEYMIGIPQVNGEGSDFRDRFMAQDAILVLKKQKKKPKPVLIDIKSKIRTLDIRSMDDSLCIHCLLDSGSESNLSPELLIAAFVEFFGLETPRSDMNVTRRKLLFKDATEARIHG